MLIVANWKAYVNDVDVAKTLTTHAKKISASSDAKIIIAPPSPLLALLSKGNRSKVFFSAQDVSLEDVGAHTGEATATLIKNVGAQYVIVGHSERRANGETVEDVSGKLKSSLIAGLTPILCVGESVRDKEGAYLAMLRGQIVSALKDLSNKERAQVVVAYEPVWAIGKSATSAITPTDLAEMVLYIRKVIAEMVPGTKSARMKILYGGSVEPENASELANGVDGFLIGHASITPELFAGICKAVA